MQGTEKTKISTRGWGGAGLTVASTVTPFIWHDMPLFLAYIGLALGLILMVLDWGPRLLSWLHIPDRDLFRPSFISLHAAATYAFTELHEVNSAMSHFAKEAGKDDPGRTLDWIADFVNTSADYRFPFYGKYSPSTKRALIPKDSVRNGRFTSGARKLILHPHHEWIELEVKKHEWETSVSNLKADSADSGPSNR